MAVRSIQATGTDDRRIFAGCQEVQVELDVAPGTGLGVGSCPLD